MDSAPPPNVAIVIGSGMAGLAAAQVLTDHFERVLLVERDHPEANNHMSAVEMAQQTAEEESRPGVTQVGACTLHSQLRTPQQMLV